MPPTEQTCSALTTASVERSNFTTTLATGRDLREWVGYQFMYVHILYDIQHKHTHTHVYYKYPYSLNLHIRMYMYIVMYVGTTLSPSLSLKRTHTHTHTHTSHLLSHNTYLNRTTAELSGAPMARSEETKKAV